MQQFGSACADACYLRVLTPDSVSRPQRDRPFL